MKISIAVQDDVYLAAAPRAEDILSTVAALRPTLKSLSRRAFVDHDKEAWGEIQRLLYLFNIEDLERRSSVTDPRRTTRQLLRNTIIEEEEAAEAPPPQLACLDHFSSDAAIRELYDVARAHRIAAHPLLIEMSKSGLPPAAVRLFLENYYINNRVFHLHIAALSLASPLELRGEMYRNLNDELGQAVFESAHPVIFLQNFRSIGRPAVISPLVESLYLLNSKVYAAFLCGDYRVGVGGFGFLELTMPTQMRQIHEGLQRSGLPEEDLGFWPLHATIDEKHGEDWFNEMRQIIATPEDAQAALRGGVRLLDARAGFFDGIWRALNGSAARELSNAPPAGEGSITLAASS